MDRVDSSDTECAVVCMIVSNDDLKRPGWKRRVNDLIRRLRDERNALHAMCHQPADAG